MAGFYVHHAFLCIVPFSPYAKNAWRNSHLLIDQIKNKSIIVTVKSLILCLIKICKNFGETRAQVIDIRQLLKYKIAKHQVTIFSNILTVYDPRSPSHEIFVCADNKR